MAIFTVTSYTQKGGEAKASIRYIQGRPGREGERQARQLFGADGGMSRDAAYRLIAEAKKGALFYRLVISPDPIREDTKRDLHLWELTRKTMQTLEDHFQQKVAWVAAEHNDHTPNRHVHVIAVLKKRLRVQELKLLRQSATHAAFFQRQQLDLSLTRDYRRAWGVRQHHRTPAGIRVTGRSSGFAPRSTHNPFNRHLCTCPYCLTTHDKRLETTTHRCHNCRRRLHVEPKLTLSRGKSREEAGWER